MIPKMTIESPGELMAPDLILPGQFVRLWSQSRAMRPVQRLVFAVLWRALLDLRKFRFAKNRRDQQLFVDAYTWISDTVPAKGFTFVFVCDQLNLDPGAARSTLLDMTNDSTTAADIESIDVDEAA